MTPGDSSFAMIETSDSKRRAVPGRAQRVDQEATDLFSGLQAALDPAIWGKVRLGGMLEPGPQSSKPPASGVRECRQLRREDQK
jgi:hypothetical protein